MSEARPNSATGPRKRRWAIAVVVAALAVSAGFANSLRLRARYARRVDELVAALKSPSLAESQRARKELSSLHTDEEIQRLAWHLGDEDSYVRSEAEDLLAANGSRATEPGLASVQDCCVRVPPRFFLKVLPARVLEVFWPYTLRDLDQIQKMSDGAARVLARIGKPAIAPLARRLNSGMSATRWVAIYALGEMREPAACDALAAALKNPDEYVRLYALYGLCDLPDPRAADAAAPYLDDKLLRYYAADVLAFHGDRRALPRILNYLKDPKANRPWMAGLLGFYREARCEAALIDVLAEKNHFLRCGAVLSLGKIGAEASIKPLEGLINDPDREVALEAAGALMLVKARALRYDYEASLKTRPHQPQASALTPPVYSQAATDLVARLSDRVSGDIEATLRRRESILLALGAYRSAEVEKALIAALDGKMAEIQRSPRDECTWLRRAAARSLAGTRNPDAVAALIEAVGDPTTRADAVRALGRSGDPGAIPALRLVLESTGAREGSRAQWQGLVGTPAGEPQGER